MKVYIENRGNETTAYGFVYADANTRGFYTIEGDKLTLGGPGSGYWFALDEYQMQQAKRELLHRFNLVEESSITRANAARRENAASGR